MSQAKQSMKVIVKTPLKRDGKRIAPDTEVSLPADEARRLLAAGAVALRPGQQKAAGDEADDPASTAPGAAGEAGELGTAADDVAGPGAQPGTEAAVNVNKASAEQIAAAANGIGISTARDLVKWRKANGRFASLDDLTQVGDIGKATVERNRGVLSV